MAFVQRIQTPAYYNEFDPGAAAWLRELIRAGLIADGEVDTRSILDVQPDDVRGFVQCHWFAGIGGWAYALRIAGVPESVNLWTGSPPCQPFSAAGQQKGRDDARHLAPKFINLVGAARPGLLFGEQVASAGVFGKTPKRARGNFVSPPDWAWLDDLSDRLEAARYALGANDFPSAGVGAPHIRQRTYFGAISHERLAQSDRGECDGIADGEGCQRNGTQAGWQQGDRELAAGGEFRGLADGAGERWDGGQAPAGSGGRFGIEASGMAGGTVNSLGAGLEGHGGHGDGSREPGRLDAHAPGSVAAAGADGGMADDTSCGWGEERQDCRWRAVRNCPEGIAAGSGAGGSDLRPSPLHGFWRDADWLFCRDGKWRPVEPGLKPLAHGVSGRVGLLRGYGNAINPHAAAEFIRAFTQAADDLCRPEPDATDLPVAFADLL